MKKLIACSLLSIAFTALPAHAQQATGREDGLDPSPIGSPTDLETNKFINDYRNSPARVMYGKLAVHDILTHLDGPDPKHPVKKGAVLTEIGAISYAILDPGATAAGRMAAGQRQTFYATGGNGQLTVNSKTAEVQDGTGFVLYPDFDFKLTNTGRAPLTFFVRSEAIPAGMPPQPDVAIYDRWQTDRRVGAHWAHVNSGGPQGLTLITISPRTMPQPHSHPMEECWIMVKGESILTLGKVTMKMEPGQAYKIPPSGVAAHSNINLSDEPVEMLYLGPASRGVPGAAGGRGGRGGRGGAPADAADGAAPAAPARGGAAPTDFARLDGTPYRYGEEQDIDMFMGDWHNAFPRIVHGNMYFRDMLTALRGSDPLHPSRRGAVLTNAEAVSFVQLEPKASAHPLKGELDGLQETFVVNSGTGSITAGGKTVQLQKDMAFILTPGLDFKITAGGDHYMTFYAVTEKLPQGFTPKAELTVVDNRNKPQTTTLWVDKERPLITKADGLSQYNALTQVEQGAMSMSRPYSADKGAEEIWIATDGETDVLLGKELRKLPAGSAYRVPSTGITAHTELNTSGKPAKFIYMAK
jgi:mannose-6-phosphate isomerase-like protein (cupin superfamily)